MMKLSLAAVSLGVLLSGCSTPVPAAKPRWDLPEGRIAFRPICATHSAPILRDVPPEGLVPAYLFGVNGASAEEIRRMTNALRNNGFGVPSEGYPAINGTWILCALGDGVLKTQAMADRLFNVMCSLEFEHIHLVHARYNAPGERNRMT